MVWNPDELDDRARALAHACLDHWPDDANGGAPPDRLRDAIQSVENAPDDAELRRFLQAFIDTAPEATGPDHPWADAPLGVLLRGLYSIARQHLRSPEARDVLRLCNEVRTSVERVGALDSHPNELMAALMVLEDAVNAIEGYSALPPFDHVDEAYLAKYGLLQAMQVGFDGAEAVARCLGARVRADAMDGGKAVKVARNIVAGHPIGGTMAGESWHHFHHRGSAHDKSMIRVMSFSRTDPENWTGQTLLTDELISDSMAVISQVLRRGLDRYSERHAER